MKTLKQLPGHLPSALAAAALLAASSLAGAQNAGGGSSSSSPAGASATAAGGTSMSAPAAPRITPAVEASHPLKSVRLSKLDGVNIYDASSHKVGEIEDVYVDARTGAVQQVVVEVGGVAGVGAKKHAVPLSQLALFSRSAEDSLPAKATITGDPKSLPAAAKPAKDSPYVKADKFVGTDVVDASGKQIGEIDEVIVDLRTGQAQFALMEFDKSWSPVDKLYAFNMSEFKAGPKPDKLLLNTSKASLEALPSVKKSALDKTDLSMLTPTASTTSPAK